MNYQVFSENQWIYPDTVIESKNCKADLYAARNSSVCFQVLCDFEINDGDVLTCDFNLDGCELIAYQLLPAHAPYNSGPDVLHAKNYDDVKEFVTRKAPFDVYDITMPVDNGLKSGRAAFYVRINVAKDAFAGKYETVLELKVGDYVISIPVAIKIYNTCIPDLKDARFHMVNWIYYHFLPNHHGVEQWSDEYYKYLAQYLKQQVDMRSDYLMLPPPRAIRDGSGIVTGFDFTDVEKVGQLALDHGFNKIMGAHIVEWTNWQKPDLVLCWDKDTDSNSIEGFRQIKLYFDQANAICKRNSWSTEYIQAICDEPQFVSSPAYRAVSAIVRQLMPGVKINDAVETTDIAGAIDTWVVKQAEYEKHKEDFQRLQAMGENMWIYTCGYPAGSMMNRVADLPLSVSRMLMWMCYFYDCTGFLHFGYHLHTDTFEKDICWHKLGDFFPPGNSQMVYPGDDKSTAWYGVRAHSQRTGAEDFELFAILGDRDKTKAKEIISGVCTSFTDYDGSAEKFDNARYMLLEYLG